MGNGPAPAVTEFAEIAQGFCAWCEGAPSSAQREVEAAAWLARLYAGALMLPLCGPENSEGAPNLPYIEVQEAKANLSVFNGYYYRECFDPDPTIEEAPVVGDIGDDLLDIYKDIKAGCVQFTRARPAEALWHWSFLHRAHWGRHTVGALLALHCLSLSKRGRENVL